MSRPRETGREAPGLMRMTPQRAIVLRVVMESGQHPTAAEVFELAKSALPTISYATVYNALRHLKQAGLIAEITFGNAASRYDGKTRRHDHSVCTKCGRLVDFDLAETSALMHAAARKTRFKPESIHLTLLGLCPECRTD